MGQERSTTGGLWPLTWLWAVVRFFGRILRRFFVVVGVFPQPCKITVKATINEAPAGVSCGQGLTACRE